MRHLLLFIFSLFFFPVNAQFTSVNSGTVNNLYNVQFAGDSVVYAVGSAGIILKSTDIGSTWSPLTSGVSADLYSCFFFDKMTGFAAGNAGVLIKTIDGGTTWQQTSFNNPDKNLRCVYFKDSQNGYTLGSFSNGGSGVLYSTNDGGVTWSGPSTHSQLQSVKFLGNLGILTGYGMIKRTIDGGQTWQTINSNTSNMLVTSFIVNEKLIFVVGGSVTGGSGSILRSTDGGQSFQSVISNSTDYLSSVFFLDDFTGYVIGGPYPSNVTNRILKTTDGGNTWFTEPSTGSRLFNMQFADANRGIIVGLNGLILRYNANFNVIKGTVYNDLTNDCMQDASEEGISGILVKAEPRPYYGVTDNSGNYYIIIPDQGTYSVQQELQNRKLISEKCPTGVQSVSFTDLNNIKKDINFGDEVLQCHLLNASISSNRRRRCFTGYTQITYCNEGNIAVENAQLKVIYPQYVTPLSSSVNWTSKNDSLITYTIGRLEAGKCGYITIKDSVACGNEAIRGLTACTKVSISPTETCLLPETDWDRSSVKVSGKCIDGIVNMEILNDGSGNMTGQHEYRIFVNDSLTYTGNFMLNSGEKLVIEILAEGKTIRLEADQHPKHPGRSRPRETVEGCTDSAANQISKGFVLNTPLDNLDEFVDIQCLPILDSYDPNDKQVSPLGILENHYIYKEDVLEYLIRFQNTGSDTAYTVVIKDTLDSSLDPLTIKITGSSHPYTWNLNGSENPVLIFKFIGINLPDSITNALQSNGFIRFRINLKSNNAPGTVIKNSANIYFDYNSPVATNETVNETWDTYPQDLSQQFRILSTSYITGIKTIKGFNAQARPNPFKENISFTLPKSGNYTLSVCNVQGMEVINKNIYSGAGEVVDLNSSNLENGIYFIHISSDDGSVAHSKLIKY